MEYLPFPRNCITRCSCFDPLFVLVNPRELSERYQNIACYDVRVEQQEKGVDIIKALAAITVATMRYTWLDEFLICFQDVEWHSPFD